MKKKKAVVLLSGGIDSATALFIAKRRGYECYPLIFDYGQRHKKEIGCAKKISRLADSRYRVLKIELPWKGSVLIDKEKALPKARPRRKGVPSTYVPARNAVFLSFALSYAEVLGACKIFIGANSIDFSGYPDCRKEFLRAFEAVAREGTKAGSYGKEIFIEAPLLLKTKSQIIREGARLKVPYEHTWSCYEGNDMPCARCDSCAIRKRGSEGAGAEDPLIKYGKD